MKTDGKLENPRKLYVAQISPILYYKFPRNNPTKIPFLSRNKFSSNNNPERRLSRNKEKLTLPTDRFHN